MAGEASLGPFPPWSPSGAIPTPSEISILPPLVIEISLKISILSPLPIEIFGKISMAREGLVRTPSRDRVCERDREREREHWMG